MSSPALTESIKRVQDLYHQIKSLDSLEPSPAANKLFSELVTIARSAPNNLPDNPQLQAIITDLRRLAGVAEGKLEAAWARQILGSEFPRLELEQFPYYSNYLLLTELEMGALRLSDRYKPRRAAFIGSGPLPLSGLLMAGKYGLEMTFIDSDDDAAKLGQAVADKLGLANVTTIVSEAAAYEDYGQFDLVILAALVGDDAAAKRDICEHLARTMRPGATLVARGAAGARRLLYPEVTAADLPGLSVDTITDPMNEVINSVVVARKPLGDVASRVEVRAAHGAQNYEAFRSFVERIIADDYGYALRPDWHVDVLDPAAVYGGERAVCLVAYDGEQPVASAALRPYDRDFAELAGRYGDETAGVWRFFVRSDYRGQGLEKLLLERLEQFAREHSYTRLYAHDQTGLAFTFNKYLHHGFAPVAAGRDDLGTIHLEKTLEDNS